MELKTRYQYTYFIYPYLIKSKNYEKYIYDLLKNKKCKLRLFEKAKDLEIYGKILPKIREFMFPSFEFSESKKRNLINLPKEKLASKLKKQTCVFLEYPIDKNIQGKSGIKDGIFFKICKIEFICFNTGICFLVLKTLVENSDKFEDILNFNYKFRDIKSELLALKQFDNIKIQTSKFNTMEKITEFINSLIGNNNSNKLLNIDTNKFLTFSYTCLDHEMWNKNKKFKDIEHEFYKYSNVLPNNYNLDIEFSNRDKNVDIIDKWEYIKFGFSNQSSVLFTSGVDAFNMTKLPLLYEKVYLYMYIIELYKKIFMQKMIADYKTENELKKLRKSFFNFTRNIWIHEITDDDIGMALCESWNEELKINRLFQQLKNEYDLFYKENNLERNNKTNRNIMLILLVALIFNIINFINIS